MQKERHGELKTRLAEVESKKREPRRAMGAMDSGTTAPATHVLYQGDFRLPREEVQPGFVSIFAPEPAEIMPPRDNTTGRRLALANWITSQENPWTASRESDLAAAFSEQALLRHRMILDTAARDQPIRSCLIGWQWNL